MAGKRTGLVERSGRFYARKVIPLELRVFFDGKNELRAPLGADRREANAKLPAHIARFEDEIAWAKRKAHGDKIEKQFGIRAHYEMNADQMAVTHYAMELETDSDSRFHPDQDSLTDLSWSQPKFVETLVNTASDRAKTDEMAATIGWAIEAFRERGNHAHKVGSREWRALAMSLAAAQLEVIDRQTERNKGVFDGQPKHPALVKANLEAAKASPVSLMVLFTAYNKEKKAAGRGVEAERRWLPVFKNFIKFLGHDDLNRVTKKDVLAWKTALLDSGLEPRTVKYSNIAALNAVLNWAKDSDLIHSNPAEGIKMTVPKKSLTREKGFRDDEAVKILRFSKAYKPSPKELPTIAAAKRWVPLLCAHTGARVGEMVQLRKEDIYEQGGIPALRITPEAGTVKAGGYRNVALHQQIVDEGFLDFVNSAPDGYLFIVVKPRDNAMSKIRSAQGRLREWLKKSDLIPEGVSPNHGWRHRLKTVGREAGIDSRVLDAIQGHAARSAGDDYGDVTLKAMWSAFSRLPSYNLG